MTQAQKLTVTRQLIRDTFRQARASGIAWMMYAVTALCVVLCLSVRISGDVSLHGGDEPPLFLPSITPRAMAPSIVLPLGGTKPLGALTLLGAGSRDWFAFEKNPQLARGEGVDTVTGKMTIAFGAIPVPLFRERREAIHFLELLLAGGMAGTVGLLLAL